MADLYKILKPVKTYWDRKTFPLQQEYNEKLRLSTTVYVGNLSFFTTHESIRQLFSMAGKIKQIIMGINQAGTPCGFCFVQYYNRDDAKYAVQFISKTKLNQRVIRVDWDSGYLPGREKGRGDGGQQLRDKFRTREDSERPSGKPLQEHTRPQRDYQQRDYQHRDYQQRGPRDNYQDRNNRDNKRQWDDKRRQQRTDRSRDYRDKRDDRRRQQNRDYGKKRQQAVVQRMQDEGY